MQDSFHCPKCQASYPLDKRRVGKAVVCTCGHRFLVPPLDYAAPPSSTPPDVPVTPRPRRSAPPTERTQPPRPAPRKAEPAPRKARPAQSSDSWSEVLPLAEPIEPAAPTAATRWADPVEMPEAEPLMEAEVVEAATSHAEPQDLTGNLFGQGGPYADPFGSQQPPLVARPLPPPPPPAKKRKKKSQAGSGKRFSEWVAYAVFFFVMPAWALSIVIGLLQPAPGQALMGPGGALPRMNSPSQPSTSASPPTATNEPPPSGYPITLWNATKRFSGEFSVEYRQDRGALDPSRQYYWVISDPSGKIEFPLPANVWKQHDKLSGKPAAAAPGQFTGPYTTFIEEQVGSSRNRISNDVQVAIVP